MLAACEPINKKRPPWLRESRCTLRTDRKTNAHQLDKVSSQYTKVPCASLRVVQNLLPSQCLENNQGVQRLRFIIAEAALLPSAACDAS
jgi:hypothetical protein